MEFFYIKIGLLIVAAAFGLWGALIVFSDKYFVYWQNRFWKEKSDYQWSPASVRVNRWGTGLGALAFGTAVSYFVIFQMQ